MPPDAAGVEAAHEGGVIHRDLKPGKVKITPAGEVKVLDFGLAKGGAGASGSASHVDLSQSPTLAYAATSAGVILGTAAYMSPEQARGKAVDRRTDIWSFGCVLYECLTGKQLFVGETVSDTIARILEREPDWSLLPPQTPAKAREMLRRCLVPSRDNRWLYFIAPASRGSAKFKLSRIAADGSTPPIVLTEWRDDWTDAAALASGDLLVMADLNTRFVRVPAAGGDPAAPIAVDAGAYRGTLVPTSALPGDRGVLLNGISYGERGWYYRIALLEATARKQGP